MQILPNPNNGSFQVTFPALCSEATMIITDVQGRMVHMMAVDQDTRTTEVNITGLVKGVYFISVRDGKNTYQAKFSAE
jgi:hypothetical protein